MKLSVFSAFAVSAFATLINAQTCVNTYGQCGGQYYTGSTTCCSGSVCTLSNQWYSQCLPGSASSPRVSPTTTVRVSPSTSPRVSPSSSPRVSPSTSPVTSPRVSPSPVTSPRVSPSSSPSSGGSTSTGAYTAPSGSASNSGNPYDGMPRYVSAAYAAKVDTSIANYASNSTRVNLLKNLKKYPTFTWMDTISALDGLKAHLDAAGAQGNGKPIVAEFVIYNLPGRDCAALASNGEIPKGGLDTYKAKYIDVVVSILKNKPSNVRLVLVLEPDSLPNLATNIGQLRCDSTTQTEYPAAVAYAIAKLSTLSDTYIYLDAGHGGWLGWPENQQKIVPIFQNALKLAQQINSSAKIRGFAAGVANYSPFDGKGACPAREKCPLQNGLYDYNPCIDEGKYVAALNTVFGAASPALPTNWIVDTSRSGQVPIRKYWGSWCNVKGAGIGTRPQTNPASGVDALVWVKPPGDSDGTSDKTATRFDGHCDPTDSTVSLGASGEDSMSGAPEAGQWFDKQIIMLVDNANPQLN